MKTKASKSDRAEIRRKLRIAVLKALIRNDEIMLRSLEPYSNDPKWRKGIERARQQIARNQKKLESLQPPPDKRP